ncbi:MAG: general secretion pathway protein [Betaproteobacteria bacterium HGW-Betaproteobacteria-22]|nr:MAG: general secretion pathway protein [Betaproteobacteria bacterium HGW-Betaproteobacteria-22]
MYYPHFGLKEPPFRITPNTDFFFSGGNRGAILDALIYAIVNGEGIIKVVGEVGSGKTMLCRMLQTILPEKIESIYLANPSVAPEDVLHAIAFELQLKLPKNADRLRVMQELQAHLLKRHAEGRQVVIFVEEAQGMPLATLEEIRLLSNLETKQDKLLQIVLFGQPELDVNLNQEHIRQLRERITHRFNLGPLQTSEVGDYLIFRLRAAGYHGPHLFSNAAIKTLSNAAQGLVRRVNILADKALLAAFADNVYQVTPKHVKAAIQDSEFDGQSAWLKLPKMGRPIMWALVVFVAALLAVLTYYLLNQSQETPPIASQSGDMAVNASSNKSEVKKTLSETQSAVAVKKTELAVSQMAPLAPSQQAMPTLGLNAPVSVPETAKLAEAHLSLMELRMRATEALLLNSNPETVTLQIKSVPASANTSGNRQDQALQAELLKLSQQVEVDNLYLYRMLQNGLPFTVILYGAYAERTQALNALKTLPADIRANRPYLRTLAGVRKDALL